MESQRTVTTAFSKLSGRQCSPMSAPTSSSHRDRTDPTATGEDQPRSVTSRPKTSPTILGSRASGPRRRPGAGPLPAPDASVAPRPLAAGRRRRTSPRDSAAWRTRLRATIAASGSSSIPSGEVSRSGGGTGSSGPLTGRPPARVRRPIRRIQPGGPRSRRPPE
ncbi:hypothetical protein ACFFX0_17235 [Citricoccus parietis]|uniref:Uncharacterized protein n=1 Tax=Citricoccus parietis TaxID=592307 RepID=A0ABV5G1P1_9MICC